MRLFVMFDLPTRSAADKKAYTDFKKFLQNDGYCMEQFSVYTRPCLGIDSANSHVERLKSNLPKKGRVSVLILTERQYENRRVLICSPGFHSKTTDIGNQMTLFF